MSKERVALSHPFFMDKIKINKSIWGTVYEFI